MQCTATMMLLSFFELPERHDKKTGEMKRPFGILHAAQVKNGDSVDKVKVDRFFLPSEQFEEFAMKIRGVSFMTRAQVTAEPAGNDSYRLVSLEIETKPASKAA